MEHDSHKVSRTSVCALLVRRFVCVRREDDEAAARDAHRSEMDVSFVEGTLFGGCPLTEVDVVVERLRPLLHGVDPCTALGPKHDVLTSFPHHTGASDTS